jgi:hypothetical protein
MRRPPVPKKMLFEVLRTVNINTVFRNVTPYKLVGRFQIFGETNSSIQGDSFSRTMEAAFFSETSVRIYPAAKMSHIP